MKILFVCSGNSDQGIGPIIINQASALTANNSGLSIDFFSIQGKGIKGYMKNIIPLRKRFKEGKYDIVHAHYSLSAIVASFAGAKPLVASLMGDDVNANPNSKLILKIFKRFFSWKAIIVKSENMKQSLNYPKALVIPNGVNLNRFIPMQREICQEKLKWNHEKKHILFTSNPQRQEKNYLLTQQAIELLQDKDVKLHCLMDVPNEETPIWYNAADVVILTSLREGSPNAIKEAMACNRPIVSTNVGDVSWLFGNTPGCYLTDFDVNNCAKKIEKAIRFSSEIGETNGRERILELGLGNNQVAERIVSIYTSILKSEYITS
ncbi:MAG: glycosyltransferase family 4 protein [Bacteroidales bacterium]|nr:glycosyltransferase family 4 protein [Bacteroidales bacterium]